MAKHNVAAADVERVQITLDEQGARTVSGRTMADINIQHLAALMLLDGDITFETSHSAKRVRDPKVPKLRERIAIVGSAALSRAKTTQAIAEIVTCDGRKLRHHTREVRGTATNPMTREDISAKSRALLVPVMGRRRAEALIAAVMGIDKIRDVRMLRRHLQN
jgi:2-methylcitrate dehydratase PrpD